jgi:hypothetical protein
MLEDQFSDAACSRSSPASSGVTHHSNTTQYWYATVRRSPFHALERAKGGRGQVVAVAGEPGGKATTYFPVIELLKSYFQIEPKDDARKIREKLTGKLLSLDRALRPTLPALSPFSTSRSMIRVAEATNYCRGIVIVTRHPRSRPGSDSRGPIAIVPPWTSATRRASVRPRPMPAASDGERARSAR